MAFLWPARIRGHWLSLCPFWPLVLPLPSPPAPRAPLGGCWSRSSSHLAPVPGSLPVRAGPAAPIFSVVAAAGRGLGGAALCCFGFAYVWVWAEAGNSRPPCPAPKKRQTVSEGTAHSSWLPTNLRILSSQLFGSQLFCPVLRACGDHERERCPVLVACSNEIAGTRAHVSTPRRPQAGRRTSGCRRPRGGAPERLVGTTPHPLPAAPQAELP